MDVNNEAGSCDNKRQAARCNIQASQQKTSSSIQTRKSSYACDLCNKQFTQLGNLKTHIVSHTDHKQYTCELCEKTFTRSGTLKSHMLVHTGEKSYACDICQKSFGQFRVLKGICLFILESNHTRIFVKYSLNHISSSVI